MAYQTVKVRKEILAEFRAACADRGDKVNTVLREAMEAYTRGTLQPIDAQGGTPAAGVELEPEVMDKARKAAEAAGETVQAFTARAIAETAQRDELGRMLKR